MPTAITAPKSGWWWLAWFSWGLGWAVYIWFSYSLTAPNLVLSGSAPFWKFQTWMWKTFFNNRELLGNVYLAIITWQVANYLGLLFLTIKKRLPVPWLMWLGGLIALLLANNALSYDVFNYIFNAKMVAVYQVNPHVRVALDFADDPWTRFMHNTHTTAPYGYGWTALSLVPFWLGLERFTLTWLLFRAWSLLSIGLTWLSLEWCIRLLRSKRGGKSLADAWQRYRLVLWLSPLLLIEIITNSHNDLWMMAPALASLGLAAARPAKKWWWMVLLSFVLLVASASIKYASLVLLPLWLALWTQELWKRWPRLSSWSRLLDWSWPWIASLAFFAPLLTTRSQQFHPWYLTWVLVWWPLSWSLAASHWNRIKGGWLWLLQTWWLIVLCLSITSLLRYAPYLYAGEFKLGVLLHQKQITWSGVGLGLGLSLLARWSPLKRQTF